MLKNIFRLSLLLLLLIPSIAKGDTPQYERRPIEKITLMVQNLAPGTSFDDKIVLARLKTKEGALFSQEDFDDDLKTLAKEYDKIEPNLEVINDKLYISLKLWPKPLIRSINWHGNENIKTERLQKELGIKTDKVFERQDFNTAFHKLKAYYVKKGYFEAELNYKVQADPTSNNVDIDINIEEGRSGRIQEIVLKNFTDKEEEDILETIMTKEYNLFTSWLNNEGTYREEMIQQDELMIVDYLQSEGYADARVHIAIFEAKKGSRIVVEITADKGVPYTFGEITFDGNTIFSDDEIEKQIFIREGDVFSPKKIRNTVQFLTNFYGTRGYIDAYVTYEPRLHPDHPVYDVDFKIEEGGMYRVGMINIIGNNCTENRVILHETRLVPGELFNINKLKETEQRLLAIGYFKHVNVYAVRSDEKCGFGPNYRDVIIEVEETGTGNLSAFFGFSTAESIFGGATLTERNFNYKGLANIFSEGYPALRGGGEYFHLKATIGSKQRSYLMSWTKPYFLDTPWIVGFDLERAENHIIARHYDIESIGLTLRAKYPINQFLMFGWHYRIRNTDVNIDDDDNPSTMLEQQAKNSGLISASGVSLIFDSTDSLIKPTEGFRSRLDTEFAGIGGHSHFFGLGYANTYYYPLYCKGVMKFRADARFILPVAGTTLQSMPLDERLYIGGETTVRGYRPYSIGPRFPEGDPSGGLSQFLLSAEYNQTINKRLDAFVFFDAGDVTHREFDVHDLYCSAGYGIRFTLFENGPPLVVGMGYPINPKNDSDVKRFFLSIGARF